jgi:hypothetical protein
MNCCVVMHLRCSVRARWSCGLVDRVSASGAEDRVFEPRHDRNRSCNSFPSRFCVSTCSGLEPAHAVHADRAYGMLNTHLEGDILSADCDSNRCTTEAVLRLPPAPRCWPAFMPPWTKNHSCCYTNSSQKAIHQC